MANDLQQNEEDLDYTRQVRKELVKEMTKGGMDKLENSSKSILLQALSDIDKAALSRKKIASDEGISNKAIAAQGIIAQLFRDPRSKKVGQIQDGEVITINAEPPKLPDNVVPFTVVPGELDESLPSEGYDEFAKRMGIE